MPALTHRNLELAVRYASLTHPSALSNLKLGVKTPDFNKISDVSVQLKSQIQS